MKVSDHINVDLTVKVSVHINIDLTVKVSDHINADLTIKVSDHINVDLTVILGTSNWSADYFIDTGGIGLVVNQNKTQADVRQQVEDIFLRDWHSNYSTNIWDFHFRRHETFHSEL